MGRSSVLHNSAKQATPKDLSGTITPSDTKRHTRKSIETFNTSAPQTNGDVLKSILIISVIYDTGLNTCFRIIEARNSSGSSVAIDAAPVACAE